MKKILFVALLAVMAFAGEVKVAVAANVGVVMNELIAEFNKTNPDTKVSYTLGASGKLATQIKNGAPFDVFMSADMEKPQILFNDLHALGKPVVYAQGALALFSAQNLAFEKKLEVLKEEGIKKIVVANPKTAPYGKAAMDAMAQTKVLENVKTKIVYGESINDVFRMAATAADIGFVAKSTFFDPKNASYKEGVNWISVDPALYKPIKQGIVQIKNSPEAGAFYRFILSANAKAIFAKYGYETK